jgi:DNA-directed RNA polymerase specialized sigma24 family protein
MHEREMMLITQLVEQDVLAEPQRLLLELRFVHQLSFRRIAECRQMCLACVHRTIQGLLKRLRDPAAAAILMAPSAFSRQNWIIAVRALVAGDSVRQIARDLRVSRAAVTVALQLAAAWYRTQSQESPASASDTRSSR